MNGLEAISGWPVTTVAAGWTQADDESTTSGPAGQSFPLASVTKPLAAIAVLVAVEEGSMTLETPLGPSGATVAHVLSHSSGLAPEAKGDGSALSGAGSRRIYSNHGYELLGEALEQATGINMAAYVHEAVIEPLGLGNTVLRGSPAHGAYSSINDLLRVGRELLQPTLLAPETVRSATTPFLPELAGVLPGFGRHEPNPWGLGFEIRGTKQPHWTGTKNSPATFGHFGRAGTFLWVDPVAQVACAALTDRQFGPWAAQAWPTFSDQVLVAAQAEG